MELKVDSHVFLGMQQDITSIQQDPKFLRTAWNIRITPRDDSPERQSNTGFVVTNERGPLDLNMYLKGRYLGHAVINQYAVIFTHEELIIPASSMDENDQEDVSDSEEEVLYAPDHIYRIDFDTPTNSDSLPKYLVNELYNGNLNFDTNHPIQTLTDYETDYILKVYWVDGINQPRVINIVSDKIGQLGDNSFDFVQNLKLNELVSVEKITGSAGEFESGVILYAFTYYNQFLLESNIFYTTPLYYISHPDRGASPLERVANAFKITVSNVDHQFDYLRVYAIQRTALDAAPIIRKLPDTRLFISEETYKEYVAEEPEQHQVEESIWDFITEEVFEGTNEKTGALILNVNLSNGLSIGYASAKDQLITTQDIIEAEDSYIVLKRNDFRNPQNLYYSSVYNDYKGKYWQYTLGDSRMKTIENCYAFSTNYYAALIILTTPGGNQYYIHFPEGTSGKYLFVEKIDGDQIRIFQGEPRPYFLVFTNNAPIGNGPDKEKQYIKTESLVDKIYTKSIYDILQDVESSSLAPDNSVTIIDIGQGEAVDPSKLIYLGGHPIVARTMDAKDGTLFLGNLTVLSLGIQVPDSNNYYSNINGASINNYVKKKLEVPINGLPCVTSSTRTVILPETSLGQYVFYNSLSVPYSGGFKYGEWYRLGLLFQHVTGKWSTPVWIGDFQQSSKPLMGELLNPAALKIPVFLCNLRYIIDVLKYNKDYVKVRPLVVFPGEIERNVVVLGFACPTLFTDTRRGTLTGEATIYNQCDLYAQSSWFTRYFTRTTSISDNNTTLDTLMYLPYDTGASGGVWDTTLSPSTYASEISINIGESTLRKQFDIKYSEIQGVYENRNKFQRDESFITFHSPEFIFKEDFWYLDYSKLKIRLAGTLTPKSKLTDIDIIAKSATISERGSGFIHTSTVLTNSVSFEDIPGKQALTCFDDFPVTDEAIELDNVKLPYRPWDKVLENNTLWQGKSLSSPVKWLVYPWHRNGSLNNDSNRLNSGENGLRSSELDTKKLSNLYYTDTSLILSTNLTSSIDDAQIFSSDLMQIIKVDGKIYQGNIDTLLAADNDSGFYFGYSTNDLFITSNVTTHNTDPVTGLVGKEGTKGCVYFKSSSASLPEKERDDIGNALDNSLAYIKPNIRMKYRSTPHLAIKLSDNLLINRSDLMILGGALPLVELYRYDQNNEDYRKLIMFGGLSESALNHNIWYPAGEPVRIDSLEDNPVIEFSWGDTWYLRYDCLKTYAFTVEDPNQIVDIISFMTESRVNLDGRYDRNRGQVNNTYMNPTIFNRMNMVYSQHDNFFNYTLVDEHILENLEFPNQVTWGNEKVPAADVDAWTDITLAATFNMDGDKGEVTALKTWMNEIYCFLNKSLSRLLFNARVLIEANDGVPIEISNNYKMDGKQYIDDSIGCNDYRAISGTSTGLYFVDSVRKLLQVCDGKQCKEISTELNMSRIFSMQDKDNHPILWHDEYNQDLYIKLAMPSPYNNLYIPDNIGDVEASCLCFSEKLGQFTSFLEYGEAKCMFNIGNDFYSCIVDVNLDNILCTEVWHMFKGDYNYFYHFGYKPFWIHFISLPDLTLFKTFTNIEMRGFLWSKHVSGELPQLISTNKLFDTVRVWHEYQDTGLTSLVKDVVYPSNTKNKQGIWRIDIPRDKDSLMTRIGGTWTNVLLGMFDTSPKIGIDPLDSTLSIVEEGNYKLEMYDTAVYYYI